MESSLLVSLLLEDVPGERFLELRLIALDGRVTQLFHNIRALRVNGWVIPGIEQWNGAANVYYGVVPRVRKGGGAADCSSAVAAWADLDYGLPPSFPLPPSVLVESSPNKYQALWLLEPHCADLGRIETMNHAIAIATNADRRACDRSRVLRLPGSSNLKYPDRPQARLRFYDPGIRYSVTHLEAAYPPARRLVTRSSWCSDAGTSPSWLRLVFDAISRHLEDAGHQLHQKSDGNTTTTCPFHDDHRPSFSFHPKRGWQCFAGCGKGRLTRLAARLGIQI